MAKEKVKAEAKTPAKENYIYAENATFRGDILEPDKKEMSERRKKRLEAGKKNSRANGVVRKRRAVRAITRILLVVTICVVIGLLSKSIYNIFALQTEKKEKEAELEALQNQILKDEDILEQVNSDEYVEQQARSELKMIKEGEVLYIVRDDGTKVEVDEDGNPVDEDSDD